MEEYKISTMTYKQMVELHSALEQEMAVRQGATFNRLVKNVCDAIQELRETIFLQYDVEIDIRSLFGMRSHRLDDILDIVYLNGEAEEHYDMDLPMVNCVITYLRDTFGGYDYVLIDAN